MKSRFTLKWTLVLSLLLAGLLPMAVSTFVIDNKARSELSEVTHSRLTADVATRKSHLETYLGTIELQAESFSQQPVVIDAVENLTRAYNTAIGSDTKTDTVTAGLSDFYRNVFLPELGHHSALSPSVEELLPTSPQAQALQYRYLVQNVFPLGEKDRLQDGGAGTPYDMYHAEYHTVFRDLLKKFGYYDIFLVDAVTGQMVYSVYKETDFATNLFTGPHKDSGLASVARQAIALDRGDSVVVDYARYLPSYDTAAAFIGTPVYSGGRLLGALVFQLPKELINRIVNTYDGLGETGESILVGTDGLRRSTSRFTGNELFLQEVIRAPGGHSPVQGKSGIVRETVNGTDYLYAHAPVEISNLEWSMLTRIETSEALSAINELNHIVLMLATIAAIVVAVFAYWLGTRLHQSLGGDPVEIYQLADSIGKGHLVEESQDQQAIGARAAMVAMRSRLREILGDTQRIAQEVRSEANSMSEGSKGLSERTEQQASNLEETSASTQEISITVRRNADNALAANELASGTKKLAIKNGELAKDAISAMEQIKQSSDRIADIIDVIDEIAFQTNLLALNAAVEAARAGEQGRGFAVVASEVRGLAGRSATAAKEIKDLINDSAQQVHGGTEIVHRSGTALEEILTSVTSLTDIVGQISIANEEQAIGIDQINQALADMDGVTQQNMELADSAAHVSSRINDLASNLSQQMDYFSIGSE